VVVVVALLLKIKVLAFFIIFIFSILFHFLFHFYFFSFFFTTDFQADSDLHPLDRRFSSKLLFNYPSDAGTVSQPLQSVGMVMPAKIFYFRCSFVHNSN